MSAALEIKGISLAVGNFRLPELSLSVPPGSHTILMGPSGCGKTSLLEAVVGLLRPEAGRILLGGQDITSLPPSARQMGYVPQDAALFRSMSVAENLGLALRIRHLPGTEIARRVDWLAGSLGIGSLLDRSAMNLSGGEQRRVAIGRALSFDPAVLLLDEPLSNLDEPIQKQLRSLLVELAKSRKITILHVTHSRTDADLLGDQVLHLDEGRLRHE